MVGWHQLGPRKNLTSCPGLVDHYNKYPASVRFSIDASPSERVKLISRFARNSTDRSWVYRIVTTFFILLSEFGQAAKRSCRNLCMAAFQYQVPIHRGCGGKTGHERDLKGAMHRHETFAKPGIFEVSRSIERLTRIGRVPRLTST
jgi:hypothetical protein